MRLEGKDYVCQDGDIFHFKFNTTVLMASSKTSSKVRLEGKDYVCQDGDIFHFKFNTIS